MKSTAIDSNLLGANSIFVGKCNSGKTTILKQIVHLAINNGYKIIVFDSATEHKEKSILRYVDSFYDNCFIIESPEKSKIVDKEQYFDEYPADVVNGCYSNIILVDVSKYLEEGFLFKDPVQREICRGYYENLVFQCLSVMYNLMDDSKKWIVIMDEIEFIAKSIDIVKKFNNKKVFFVNCLHNLASCSKELLNLFSVHQLETQYPNISIESITKPIDMLCGSSCLHYYLNCILDLHADIPKQLFWITDLANYLVLHDIEHTVYCHNSNLYSDFKSKVLKTTCPDGHKSLHKFLNTGHCIVEKEFACEDITKNINPNKYLIASVQSRLLFNDKTRNGYHYILIHQSMDKYTVISPSESGFQSIDIPIVELVNMIKTSGCWVISIN
ncbi:MAG: hypothetical protein MJZ20_11670 [Bacteroidaceae bacterium]|nr:hypothetical protein [Bacteroidaceae bacterium]